MRLALHAALAALPPTALFGLVVVGETIGAHLLGGAVPHVVRVPIPAEGEPTLPLRVAVPLRRMLAPPAPPPPPSPRRSRRCARWTTTAAGANGGAPRRRCGLGSAVRAILDGFAVDGGAASSRVLLFLGGPPDYGDGTLAPPPPPPAGSAAAAAAATPLLSVTTEDPEAAAAARRPEDDGRFSENAAPVLFDDGREPMSAAAKAAAAGRVAGRVGGRAAVAARARRRRRRARSAAARRRRRCRTHGSVQLMRPQGGSGGRLWATLGDEAAAAGVTVDLYLAAPTDGILATLRQLVDPTGGAISYYPLEAPPGDSPAAAQGNGVAADGDAVTAELRHVTFADDVTANLHAPHASSGEMRLRCSPEFGVARAYGGIAEVVGGDGVYRVGGRHAHTAAAFDFEFETSAGFGYDYESLPTLQLAYYYAAYLPIDEDEEPSEEGEEGGEGGGSPSSSPGRGIARRWRLVRRLRVSTLQLQVARGARHLYESANGAECVALLTQKVLCAAVDEGFREARLLLQDWLVVVLGKYHRMYGAHADRIGDPDALCRSLRQIPRWVFALLGGRCSRRTRRCRRTRCARARAALLASYATLPPRRLLTAIYPALLLPLRR